MGVHSASEEQPFKIANFKLRDRDLEGAKKYSDWKFVFAPPQAKTPAPAPPAKALYAFVGAGPELR